MVVASTDILHAIAVEVYLIWAWDSVKLCQTIVSLCIATYATSVLLTFTFLWLRQRILYANRLLQHLSNHATQALSWISIVGISAAILASALPHTVWTKYELSNMVRCWWVFINPYLLPLPTTDQSVSTSVLAGLEFDSTPGFTNT